LQDRDVPALGGECGLFFQAQLVAVKPKRRFVIVDGYHQAQLSHGCHSLRIMTRTNGRMDSVSEVEIFDSRRCELGEGPHYDERTGRVWWVDILGCRVL